ncbi:MAG: HAD-IIA family hydrolase [Ignavibacteriales bacterium]|nr:HAD-IIA family hydrolase [Ignavibacteriales bacterium]
MKIFPLHKYEGFIFDLDGTLYRGENIIPKADITINILRKLNKKLVFISNKTTGTCKEYSDLLKKYGMIISEDEIINSTYVIKKYLSTNYPGKTFYSISEDVFIKELCEVGLKFSKDVSKINIVIVTLDRTLNYTKLEIAAKALDNGAKFLAANIDNTCPVENGEIIDAGSTISALEKRTGRKLEKHFGKPSKFMIEEIKKYLKLSPGECIIIGDRLETDIAMGNTFGIDTALVLSGVKNPINKFSEIKPTYKIKSVYELIRNAK